MKATKTSFIMALLTMGIGASVWAAPGWKYILLRYDSSTGVVYNEEDTARTIGKPTPLKSFATATTSSCGTIADFLGTFYGQSIMIMDKNDTGANKKGTQFHMD